jgi:hypothetical protein
LSSFYPSGQGPFNLEQPSSQMYRQSLAKHKLLTPAGMVPEAQMSM